MYRGLLYRVKSPEFICDLGLMYDTLHELSLLSQGASSSFYNSPQSRASAETLRVIQSFKESPGEKYCEALEAKETGEYRSIALSQSIQASSYKVL